MANAPIALAARAPSVAAAAGLPAEARLETGLRWMVEGRLAAITTHIEAMTTAADVARVHDFRRDVTRLRAILRLFANAFSPSDRQWLDDELAALARPFGEVRDLDIFLRALARRQHAAPSASGKTALRFTIATSARRMAESRALSELHGARAWFLTRSLCVWMRDSDALRDWDEAATPFATKAPRLLEPLLDRLPSGNSRPGKLGPTLRHRLRKRLKVLRYSAEAIGVALGEPDARADPGLLHVLDILGDLNDALSGQRLWKRLFEPLGLAGHGASGFRDQEKRRLRALSDAWQMFRNSAAEPCRLGAPGRSL